MAGSSACVINMIHLRASAVSTLAFIHQRIIEFAHRALLAIFFGIAVELLKTLAVAGSNDMCLGEISVTNAFVDLLGIDKAGKL